MNLWTSEDIARILIQLDERQLPFAKYSFVKSGSALNLLGRGGFAEVYEAESRQRHKNKYAIKVIGFRKQCIDTDFFVESVEAQKEIGDFQDNVVKIYAYTELWVTLDEQDNVISAAEEKPEKLPQTSIRLQFIAMEKISSVIERTGNGNLRVTPERLAAGDEQEVLKLAYDIGLALKRAHHNRILHRDVKLENVFYCAAENQYKLGDFGIARKTEEGFASTIVFTRGYAAPEVRGSEDRYDNTADIYSFGMMLYVIMNHFAFPQSDTYSVNSGAQYCAGYIVPCPQGNISEDFYHVIARACMYDPDDRYQSMEEMLLDIEKLMYSDSVGYRKEHKKESLIAGTILLALGIAAWKVTLAAEMAITFSFWEYLFLAACLGKGVQKIFQKNVVFVSMLVLGVGVYLLISSGFTWMKLLFLICMTFSSGTLSGYAAAGALLVDFLSWLQQTGSADWCLYEKDSWIAVAAISLAAVLLYQYAVLSLEDRKIVKVIYRKGLYWTLICFSYGTLIVAENAYRRLPGNEVADMLLSAVNLRMVGMTGLGFCVFWIIRERILIRYQRIRSERR